MVIGMTEEEIEAVAEELAKIGGVSWYPGRTTDEPFLRVVHERYRDRARVAIAALERIRALKASLVEPAHPATESPQIDQEPAHGQDDKLYVGAIVVYRAPGERRATSYRIEKLEPGRAYLVPCPKPDLGWVSTVNLTPLDRDATGNPLDPHLESCER